MAGAAPGAARAGESSLAMAPVGVGVAATVEEVGMAAEGLAEVVMAAAAMGVAEKAVAAKAAAVEQEAMRAVGLAVAERETETAAVVTTAAVEEMAAASEGGVSVGCMAEAGREVVEEAARAVAWRGGPRAVLVGRGGRWEGAGG